MRDIGDDTPLTLMDACLLEFGGSITQATLKAEHRRGNLVIEKIGRRLFTTRANLKAMRTKCRVDLSEKDPAYGSSPSEREAMAASNLHAGLYATDPSSAARAALQTTLAALKKR